jgi:hypothetical protein
VRKRAGARYLLLNMAVNTKINCKGEIMQNLQAGTKEQIINSLFMPFGTIDIEIHKTTKNTVKLSYLNEKFTLNCHGVLTQESTQDGKVWYFFCCSNVPEKEIKQALLKWLTVNKNNYQFTYKLQCGVK